MEWEEDEDGPDGNDFSELGFFSGIELIFTSYSFSEGEEKRRKGEGAASP